MSTALLLPIHDFLGCATPQAWIDAAIHNIPLLIQDHANCEKKAASTGMSLMFKYNDKMDLQIKLAQLVREEMLHYEQVLDLMQQRAQPWVNLSASRYAQSLRQHIRTYEPAAFVDVMIIGAFVEARSCERFAALVPYVDDTLAKFYRYLLKSESRHFADYLALALQSGAQDVDARIALFRQIESDLILSADTEMRFHSGVPA